MHVHSILKDAWYTQRAPPALQYTQLRARLVCHATHSAASDACCKDSGTTQLQHMLYDSDITAEHMIGSIHTGHKAGCLQHCNAQLRAVPVCYAKLSADPYACCKIQAQHSFSTCSDSENTACTACIYTQATKQGVSSTAMHS